MKAPNRQLLLPLLVLVGLLLSACGVMGITTPTPPPESVTLLLDWFDSPQFAGFYVAQAQGYYARQGLAVTIVPLADVADGSGIPARVAAGEAEFAVSGVVAIDAQMSGVPLTAVAGVLQHNPAVLFARADSGIQSPRDFIGRRIGIKGPYWHETIRQVMDKAGVSLDTAIEVPIGRDMQPFFDGQVDVWTGFALDEPIIAELAGIDLVRIYAYEYGLGGYGMVLYTTHANVAQRPELVARFVRASLDGWNEVVRDPAGTVDLLLARDPPVGRPDYVAASVEMLIPLVYTGEHPIGWITPDAWAATYRKEVITPDDLPAGSVDISFVESYYVGAR